MTMTNPWQPVYDHIVSSFSKAAQIQYGESAVTELEHALQCAELADKASADDDLVFACMLHDVARFALPQNQISDTLQNTELDKNAKGHGAAAAEMMDGLLPQRSLFCIKHHAEAKQYLCQTNPRYREKLAAASIKTLAIQAAETDGQQLETLSRHEWWPDALRVRVWDDGAKIKGKTTRSFDYWNGRLERFLLLQHS